MLVQAAGDADRVGEGVAEDLDECEYGGKVGGGD